MTMHQLTPRRHVKSNVHPCRSANIGTLVETFVGFVLTLVVGDNMITVMRMEQESVSWVPTCMQQNMVLFEIQTNPLSFF